LQAVRFAVHDTVLWFLVLRVAAGTATVPQHFYNLIVFCNHCDTSFFHKFI